MPDDYKQLSVPDAEPALPETILDQINDAVVFFDRQWRFSYVNRSAEQMAGRGRAELLGKVLWEEYPDSTEIFRREAHRAMRDRVSVRFEAFYPRFGRWFEVSCFPTESGLVTIYHDVTEHKQREQELAEREQFLETIIETEPECVKLVDAGGIIRRINRAGLAMLEAEATAQVVGKPVYQFLPPECHEPFRELNERIFRGESARLEHPMVGLRGTVRLMETRAVPLHNRNGAIFAQLSITHDLTERRNLEEQLRQAQKMEAVGRLAGGVAHDFNNLLTAIISYSDLLALQLGANKPLREYAQEIRRASERAANLTYQLLAFSRKQILQPKVLDLNAAVADVGKMIRRLIGEDIELVTRLAPRLGPVNVDPGQLTQVVMNLAVNARDAMPRGGKLVIETADVEFRVEDALPEQGMTPGRYVLLAVTDTGHGMDAETRARIFEPFFTTKEVGKGTGLGLATVYGIVRQSGGYVAVESEPGQGTTFRVYLPWAAAQAPAAGEAEATALPQGHEIILLVEDEEIIRSLARRILEGCGYRVLEAGSGAEAIGLQPGCAIELLVTDVVMPGMSGRELAERLRAACPTLRVLYMSGYTDDAVLKYGVSIREAEFLQKPFTPAQLARKVRQVLDADGQG